MMSGRKFSAAVGLRTCSSCVCEVYYICSPLTKTYSTASSSTKSLTGTALGSNVGLRALAHIPAKPEPGPTPAPDAM